MTRWLVSDVPLPDNNGDAGLQTCEGFSYRLPASLWDITTIPIPTFTTVRICSQLANVPPRVWRSNTVRRGAVVELETFSDAKLRSMAEEAYRCWQQLAEDIKKRISWMHLLGGHEDIQNRMASPLVVYQIEIRTLHDDFLARLFAQGSADIAYQAEALHRVITAPRNTEPEPEVCEFTKFLWPCRQELPSWAAERYARALSNDYNNFTHSPAL